jgi:hypothetical protein
MDLTEEYIIEYFEIHSKLVQFLKNKFLNKFHNGDLKKFTQEEFFAKDLLFMLHHKDVENFKHQNNEIYKEIKYNIKKVEEQSLCEIKSTRDLVISNYNGINDRYKSLSVTPINDKYSWGKFGDLNIVICLKNSYINGSVLIEEGLKYENELRKKMQLNILKRSDFNDWLINDTTKVLLQTVSAKLNINISELIFNISGKQKKGEEMLQGYFIHPILINVLAEWVSPSYAIIVSEIMSNYHIKNKEDNDNKRIMELENAVRKKDLDIQELFKRIDEQNLKNQKLYEDSVVLTNKNEKLYKKNDDLKNKNEKLIEDLKDSLSKLNKSLGFIDEKKNDIRLPSNYHNTHYILIYEIKDFEGNFYYKTYRRKAKRLVSFLDTEKLKYARFVEVICSSAVNAIQTWCTFKQINNNFYFINSSSTDFKLVEGYSIEEFKDGFEKLLKTNLTEIKNIL